MAIQSFNPATEELIKSFKPYSNRKVEEIINKVQTSFEHWKLTSFSHRKNLLLKVAKVLRNEKMHYAKILTLEMGKPIKQAIAEVEKCALVCEYYANNAEKILSNEIIKSDASESYVQFDPIGIVFAVMPWNFPFWQVFRFAAPALIAGNAGVLKHASNVPMSALAIEEIFIKAGLPEDIFRTILINSDQVEEVIINPIIKATTLTGSEYAGSMVASQSGKMLKKSVMELGGSDPFIVLKDADIDLATSTAITARLLNNGQSCIAAKRFIVVEEIYNEFESLFAKKMENIKIGDPMDESSELGPIAREDLLNELEGQVQQSIRLGAKVIVGGKRLDRQGFYYPATILGKVKKGMPAYDEELFGPIASLIKVKDENEALNVANDTVYGLGSSLWTKDIEKAKLLTKEIDAGSVFINGLVKSDPRLPFGGVKLSGFGRELSHYGIKEFVNIKTIWIR